ncbi:MAG: hypothetical protein H7843_07010 [Nitrospirota bacterium]
MPEETLRGKYIRQVEVLSQLRDLQEDVCKKAEAMALVYDLERDVRFKQGRERGLLEGEQRGIERGKIEGNEEGKQEGLLAGERKGLLEGIELGLELKFGSAGLELMNMVRAIPTVDKLEGFKNLIKKADSADELKGFFGEAYKILKSSPFVII